MTRKAHGDYAVWTCLAQSDKGHGEITIRVGIRDERSLRGYSKRKARPPDMQQGGVCNNDARVESDERAKTVVVRTVSKSEIGLLVVKRANEGVW